MGDPFSHADVFTADFTWSPALSVICLNCQYLMDSFSALAALLASPFLSCGAVDLLTPLRSLCSGLSPSCRLMAVTPGLEGSAAHLCLPSSSLPPCSSYLWERAGKNQFSLKL